MRFWSYQMTFGKLTKSRMFKIAAGGEATAVYDAENADKMVDKDYKMTQYDMLCMF